MTPLWLGQSKELARTLSSGDELGHFHTVDAVIQSGQWVGVGFREGILLPEVDAKTGHAIKLGLERNGNKRKLIHYYRLPHHTTTPREELPHLVPG
ncbi:hypothetical protein Pcinc_003192 [Petrolisthes cinctipes]|uniref:Uncharacterized protein n=1 Tax=Petrolisthes cinctipes TaxID=88211 RepID=A0AAE1GP39_PETCI|nr:hypothetical protein Pcinc_003192 [Petrolisthes cinctipes]